MELDVDPRQPSRSAGRLAGALRICGSWVWPSTMTARSSGTARREYSYWAECECPDDCLRDHENE